MAHLQIPVLHRKMGVTDFSADMAGSIRAASVRPENRFMEIVGALVNVHKEDYNDTREIREKFAGMRISVAQEGARITLECEDVPEDCLYDGKNVIWASVEQISAAVRDIVFAPVPPVHGHDANGASLPGRPPGSFDVSLWLRRFVEHAGFLYRGERGLVMFVWGGHRIPREEYEFAKRVGYWLALAVPEIEIITGCGAGVMKAPFKGAQVAYSKQRSFERFGRRDFIGFTEKNILAAEPPNELVNRFVVFPAIESRMEAFIRASHRGIVHPGGVGTIEEIMTMLAVKSLPDNRGARYGFDLVEGEESGYFAAFEDYLRTCVGDACEGMYKRHQGRARDYALHVAEVTRKLPMRYLWNEELVFHPLLQKPFEVTFESMEALDLSTDQDLFGLLVNLRRFFSAIVHLSVKDPDMLESWGDERPLIRGHPRVLRATDEFVRRLQAQGRMHPSSLRATPYRVA